MMDTGGCRYSMCFTGVPWPKLWAGYKRLVREQRMYAPTRGTVLRAAWWMVHGKCPHCGHELNREGGLKAHCVACGWVWGQDI